MGTLSIRLVALATFALTTASCARTAPPPAPAPVTTAASSDQAILLTIFLRHDQTKTLAQIKEHLAKTEFTQNFPPPGVEVVSWYVMMGIGQVVTLRVPPDKLREVNLACEQRAWGAYRTEFYPTYDYRAIHEADRQRLQITK
ncbi:hypothetical protein LVJ94_22780 [Pendulispora rubella]|uniref:Lipoprotein n=1 Tax=Pendulispora rubella TaxID=2741070 RepID=A0ABZ2LGI0_9BACT